MLETLIGILGTVVVGSTGWAIHLGNRVTKVETKQEDLPELIKSQFGDVHRRLDRIERAMNGRLDPH